ncbi:MAG: histidine--tRNA ligase [Dehalococcoidia bacterium]|nr:MAG: histidine--tRNA ligase [Dehalococcoidia bacterium]
MFQSPRGTQDILPAEQPYWRYIQQAAEVTASLYGYERIDTPVFEEAGLFVRTVGEGTDIVEKEMYTFTDLGGGQMTLRPEGTAPVCRAYIEHGMASLPQPVKLFYQAPIFRYERPQAGRFRQHHQFGFEAIGDGDATLDAELIDLAWRFFQTLGLKSLTLQINSIGCPACRPAYLAKLKEYYAAHQEALCGDCKVRLDKNTLRLLDCKKPTCQPLAQQAPRSIDNLCPECAAHFEQLKRNLSTLKLPFEINSSMVRGLDYYTRTVFEIQPEEERGQSTIAGGGRYDGLIEELGGKPTPGVGFATGIERIILNLKKQNVAVPGAFKPSVFVVWLGDEAREAAVKLIGDLRQADISAVTSYSPRSMKAQLRQADGAGCHFAAIIGEEELAQGSVTLRDMRTAQQEPVAVNKLMEKLTAH